MNNEKRPAYFRFFLEACNMISLLDVESAGRVIHAVSDYFTENIEPENLSKNERTVFNRIRRDVDKSFSDYEEAVTYGKQGAAKRHKGKGSKGGYRDPIGGLPNPEPKTQNPKPRTQNQKPKTHNNRFDRTSTLTSGRTSTRTSQRELGDVDNEGAFVYPDITVS